MLANSGVVVAAIADRGPASTTPATVSAVRIERLRSVSFRDSIPSPPRRLSEGTGQTPEWTYRSCRNLSAVQSRRPLWTIFRPARPAIVCAMVSKVGRGSAKNSKIEWFIFSERRVGAVEPNVASRNRDGIPRSVCFAEYNSLDQIDYD